ncbi:MAG TPA: ATP-binding protein [Steroidobacteraceae bacterium]|jgi:signal transduction histidine kinase|nr:ATP-binding protein [Steroidobacteraceae bacterium]
MNATLRPEPDRLARDYRGALYDYVACAGEAPLARAYQLGRDAIAEGRSIPDLVGIHGAVLHELLAGDTGGGVRADGLVNSAAQFLAESLSPFEMTHRGYRDSLIAWRHINETLEQEIRRIAHALHDESGQLLVSVHLELARLAREVPAARPHVERSQQLLERVERQLRELSHELRPAVLDDLGWLAAIEFLATAVTGRTRIPIEVRSGVTQRLPAAAEIALYRTVQEALTNAARHAAASCVRVEIEQRPDGLHGVIADDGVGFEVEACVRNGGLGLKGMRERLEAVGGSLRIISAPGNGAEIRFRLPLGS